MNYNVGKKKRKEDYKSVPFMLHCLSVTDEGDEAQNDPLMATWKFNDPIRYAQ